MDEIGAFQAKNTLGTLLDRVERGEEIVITRHGKAVARLTPMTDRIDQLQAQTAALRIRERAKSLQPAVAFDWKRLKALREEGLP